MEEVGSEKKEGLVGGMEGGGEGGGYCAEGWVVVVAVLCRQSEARQVGSRCGFAQGRCE